jgi:predicted amidophosphoribosyltransferase
LGSDALGRVILSPYCKMDGGGIIILMYNKGSCRECGTYLTSISLCEVCGEQISWICSNCDKTYDVTHAHNVILYGVLFNAENIRLAYESGIKLMHTKKKATTGLKLKIRN